MLKDEDRKSWFYGYLNLESTKTVSAVGFPWHMFYGYLNLESTKTIECNPNLMA